ncbi:hypothetical protein ADU37_CDS01630 [Thermococcus sp. 2319x1]|nr:hypothetical protein ADU37_CDS01630 [Thermococcus sp. 2319x1]
MLTPFEVQVPIFKFCHKNVKSLKEGKDARLLPSKDQWD